MRPLALSIIAFFIMWTLLVYAVWVQGWLAEAYRPWLRNTFWCLIAVLWIAWLRPPHPLRWSGIAPVTWKIISISIASFAVLLAWNWGRVSFIVPPRGQLAGLTPAALAWGPVGVAVEEFMFRGVVQGALVARLSAPKAIIIAAILFTAIRAPGWYRLAIPVGPGVVLSVFLIGILCGALWHWTGSLWPAVATHWSNNLGALI